MAENEDNTSTESTGPSEGFVKGVAFLIVAAFVYRRWL